MIISVIAMGMNGNRRRDGCAPRGPVFAPTIDSMTTVDLQYNLEIPAFSMSEGGNMTLGIKNVGNEEPPIENVDGGYDYFTHDPIGRIYYARFTVAF